MNYFILFPVDQVVNLFLNKMNKDYQFFPFMEDKAGQIEFY